MLEEDMREEMDIDSCLLQNKILHEKISFSTLTIMNPHLYPSFRSIITLEGDYFRLRF